MLTPPEPGASGRRHPWSLRTAHRRCGHESSRVSSRSSCRLDQRCRERLREVCGGADAGDASRRDSSRSWSLRDRVLKNRRSAQLLRDARSHRHHVARWRAGIFALVVERTRYDSARHIAGLRGVARRGPRLRSQSRSGSRCTRQEGCAQEHRRHCRLRSRLFHDRARDRFSG